MGISAADSKSKSTNSPPAHNHVQNLEFKI